MNISLEDLTITVIGIVGGSTITNPVYIRANFELPNGQESSFTFDIRTQVTTCTISYLITNS